jgi:hypothetical protein
MPQYPFDVAAANRLLDEAGHRRGAGGLRFSLLLAGDGSWARPFYLDGSDALVRAVPSAPGLSRFIDGEWIDFVAEFNARARALTAGALGA